MDVMNKFHCLKVSESKQQSSSERPSKRRRVESSTSSSPSQSGSLKRVVFDDDDDDEQSQASNEQKLLLEVEPEVMPADPEPVAVAEEAEDDLEYVPLENLQGGDGLQSSVYSRLGLSQEEVVDLEMEDRQAVRDGVDFCFLCHASPRCVDDPQRQNPYIKMLHDIQTEHIGKVDLNYVALMMKRYYNRSIRGYHMVELPLRRRTWRLDVIRNHILYHDPSPMKDALVATHRIRQLLSVCSNTLVMRDGGGQHLVDKNNVRLWLQLLKEQNRQTETLLRMNAK